MAVSLNSIPLPDGMVWADRWASSRVAQTVHRTLAGKQIISSLQLVAGRPVTLIAGEDYGWLTLDIVNQIRALADVVVATYTLVYGSDTLTVAFRHEQPPAVDFKPLVDRASPDTTDYFTGTIKLITV